MSTHSVASPNLHDTSGDMGTWKKGAFERLPDEIVEQVLQFANPNTFASLIILNRKWRIVSQQAHLYAYHLSRCPSYSAAHSSLPVAEDEESLPRLRRLFAREIKRNLFEAYLRPKETVINLVSTSISSSSAPGGEAFHFSLSPRGHYLLAYSSSRIHVLDVTGKDVAVKRELKILRRPASTTITDDGSLLAVLSTDMQVDLYDLTSEHPKHTKAVVLDHTPRTIALSPTGSVLAAAYDSGVEVSSLESHSSTTERRAVKCYAVDSLSFSIDGTQLLGTTVQSRNPSTVILTAPYYDPGGNLPEESTSALWTSSILFPNGSRDCSHAVLLPSASEEEASWTFTYDRVFETFRAVRIDDLRNGTTYFTGPTADTVSKLLPSTLPAASESGDLVVSGFQGSIWLYGVPEDLEALPTLNGSNSNVESEVSTPSSLLGRRNSAPSLRSNTRGRENTTRTPQWQLLCDKARNNFVEGRKISSLDRVSAMIWVNGFSSSALEERLIAVAPGVGGHAPESEDESMHPTDGGRISIIDFGYNIKDGEKRIITIEVGDKVPQVLEEEHMDLDTEVALVRRRTVAQRRGNRNHVSRSATTVARSTRPEVPPMPNLNVASETFVTNVAHRRPNLPPVPSADASETASLDEDEEAFDAPYSQTNPRSVTTLRRAATAAAVNRRLHPRAVAQEHIEYRRADGREEHPHESDADNWVPPPPPYSKEPVPPLPEHIQRSILAEATATNLQRGSTQRAPIVDSPGLGGNSLQRSRTLASVGSVSPSRDTRADHFPFPRTVSESMTTTSFRPSSSEELSGRVPSPVSDFDDLYDVSPNGSPQQAPQRLSEPVPEIGEDTSPLSTPEVTPLTPPAILAPSHHMSRKPINQNASPVETPQGPDITMCATIQQPISPLHHPQPKTEQLDRRLLDWEKTTDSTGSAVNGGVVNDRATVPSSHTLAREGTKRDVPTRLTGDNHLIQLPPDAPVKQALNRRKEEVELQPSLLSRRSDTAPTKARSPQVLDDDPLPVSQRAKTTPIPAKSSDVTAYNGNSSAMYNLSMPSAEQLASLHSRRERPASQSFTDSQCASGNFNQPRMLSNSSRRAVSGGESSSWGSMQLPPHPNVDQSSRSTPPRGAAGAHGSLPSRSNTSYSPKARNSLQNPHRSSQQSNYANPQGPFPPSRRISLNVPPHNQTRLSPVIQSPNNLRPDIERLETIHSMNSTGEQGLYHLQKPITPNLVRNPSRAERSAAKNIKDAKSRGWRASIRGEKKKRKWNDASSAGWTDVSDMRSMPDDGARAGKKEKSGKCAVM